jgi:hypothetical protein
VQLRSRFHEKARAVAKLNYFRASGVSYCVLALVIGLHAFAVAWLWLAPPVLIASDVAEAPSLIVVTGPRAPVVARNPVAWRAPAPHALSIALSVPLAPASLQTLSVQRASTEESIEEAPPGNIARITRVCGAPRSRPSRRAADVESRNLLVLVEPDGHISQSRIEHASVVQVLDEPLQHCVLTHVILDPARVHGEPVVSWQRVPWLALAVADR